MKHAILARADAYGRAVTPFAATLSLAILNLVPLIPPTFGKVEPGLPLIAVFYWAIQRPESLPPYAAFAIGLFQDILTNSPPGVNALVLTLLYYAMTSQRLFFVRRPFTAYWLGFGVAAMLAVTAIYLLNAIWHGALLSPLPSLFQFLVTVLLYPLVAWLLMLLQRVVLRDDIWSKA